MNSFGVDLPDTETLLAEEVDVLFLARVILYNDETHTFDEVSLQLMKATGCSIQQGEHLAVEVDTRGLACVFEGEITDCLRASSILEEIALNTEVTY